MKMFKKIWFLVLLAVLFLPMMQTCFHLVDEKPLDGAYVPAKKPIVNATTLYQETAQDSLMNWCTEQTGFRNSMIRVNNQMLYSAFGKIPVTHLVKGKDGPEKRRKKWRRSLWRASPTNTWPSVVRPTIIKAI